MELISGWDALKSSVWDDIIWLKQDVKKTLEKAEISESVKEIVINKLFPNG
jgi:hypothetical protein